MRILTPDQRLRVFVSSTLEELGPERIAARNAIASLQLTPVMFELAARPHPAADLYQSYLAQSQVFVGIYWQSYGWVAPGAAVSGVEDEFRRAGSKPRLLYVKEPAPARDERLTEFVRTLESEGVVSYTRFADAAELESLIRNDLALLLSERFAEQRPLAAALPSPATSFVGREPELAHAEQLVADGARLITLTGPGGSGKTRLAVEAARRIGPMFDDGVAFVRLESLASAELVPMTIAQALGLRDLGQDAIDGLVAHLRQRELLLVLDNYEQVIEAAWVVTTLVENAPRLTVLVTSREVLHVRGENELRVPPLSPYDDAVRLFADRAASAFDGFALDDDERPVVERICRTLDGMPLAIELAASGIRTMTVEQLLERLERRVSMQGPRDMPKRQRTLSATIAWSYHLLSAEEQLMLHRLGAIRGTFTLAHVEALCPADTERPLIETLEALVDKSVVQRVPGARSVRFALLTTIRDFALARLEETGAREETLERLTAFYLDLAPELEAGLRSPGRHRWTEFVELEIDSLRDVYARLAEQHRAADMVALLRALWLWFWLNGFFDEPRRWTEMVPAHDPSLDADASGWLHFASGIFSLFQLDLAPAAIAVSQAQQLFEDAGDRLGLCLASIQAAYATAAIAGEDEGMALAEQGLQLAEELDDPWIRAAALSVLCRLLSVFGRYEGAGTVFEDGLEAAQLVDNDLHSALAAINLADYHLAVGELDNAEHRLELAVDIMRAHGMRYAAPDLLETTARIAAQRGDPVRAAEMTGTADDLRTEMKNPRWGPLAERYDDFVAGLRAALGAERFEQAQARGRGQTLEHWLAAAAPGQRVGLAAP